MSDHVMVIRRLAIAAVLVAVAFVAALGARQFGPPLPPPPPPPPPPIAPAFDTPLREAGPFAFNGTGVIAGRVVQHDTEARPVRQAIVALVASNVTRRTAVTDDEGRFAFDRLPAGHYLLKLSKPAYVSTTYGATSAGAQGLTIALADGQRLTDIVAPIVRGAVLTGRIVDQNGAPLVSAPVFLYQPVVVNGDPSYRRGGGTSLTDDRGVYRAYGLEAGAYVVGAAPRPGAVRVVTQDEIDWLQRRATTPGAAGTPAPATRPIKYANAYYPGVVNIDDATPVTLTEGQERAGVDFVARMVPTVALSGHLTRADGGSLQNVPVSLLLSNPGVSEGSANMRSRPVVDGEFSFPDLEPGQYTLQARVAGNPASDPKAAGLSAKVDVTLGSDDVTNVNLVLDAGVTVTGRVTFDTVNTPPGEGGPVLVRLQPPAGPSAAVALSMASATANPDGAFSLASVQPGTYVLFATLPLPAARETWALRSATIDGRDVLDTPFELRAGVTPSPIEVHFTNELTTLTGMFSDQSGRPISDYSLIVFPTNPARWGQNSRWMRAPSRPSSDGRFLFTGLPPGEYYLAAITKYDPQEWYTRPFLERVLPGAIKITLTAGQTTTQDLRVR
jgi:hypothetical protein